MAKCKWCGQTFSPGKGCAYSTNKHHEKQNLGESPSSCVFCGSRSYGPGCTYSPTKMHKHNSTKDGACIWCGSKSSGFGCPYSSERLHEK